jgi:uncharacterized cupredoxin-like copper-binding protein
MIRAVPLALALLLVACAPDDEGGQATPEPGEQVVAVTLVEHEIQIDGTATAGEVFFELSNDGDQAHGFAITGGGLDETLVTDVQPGTIERVSVELEAGTYTLWCPIGDHRDLGMETELQVGEASGS